MRIYIVLLIFLNCTHVFSQDNITNYFSIRYGEVALGGTPVDFSNWQKTSYDSTTGISNYRYNNMSPIYTLKPIIFKAVIAKDKNKFIGIELTYNSLAASGYSIDSVWNSSENFYVTSKKSTYYNMHRMRLQLRIEKHFTTSNEKMKLYLGGGLGISQKFRKYTENGIKANLSNSGINSTNFPLSLKFSGGISYFFSNQVGMNAELGIGGPLLSFGFIGKF